MHISYAHKIYARIRSLVNTVCSIVECSMHKSAQLLNIYLATRYLGIQRIFRYGRYMVFKYLALQLKIIKLSNLIQIKISNLNELNI